MYISTDLPPAPQRDPWYVPGVTRRCQICNGLHKDSHETNAGSCLFYSCNGGPSGTPMIRAKNMLNHDCVIYKQDRRWVISFRFIDELKDRILPKLGFNDSRDIDKFISELNSCAKRMGDQENKGYKSMNVSVDLDEYEAENTQRLPYKSSYKQVKVSPTKSVLKNSAPKPVVRKHYQEEDSSEEENLDDDM